MWSGTAKIEHIHGGGLFRLLEDLTYVDYDSRQFRIRTGFEFDGASIPKFAQSIVGPPVAAGYLEDACLHDAVCRCGIFEIKWCDHLMRRSMTKNKVPRETINSIMLGLAISRLWRRMPEPDPRMAEYLLIGGYE